ncbi:hypothetical protein [Candidatus Nitrosotalea bavarica]|uniref:hypothetical protein n=1 Tax=Candidatus Nitrosotalea bavarica TaxID=1903277 RepID=UPI000C703B59|nr:hypothetical protein [Candidatus Nitrosotalea bavarica]
MSSYVVERNLGQYIFFMDVSPAWWLNHRSSDEKIIKYIMDKFGRDYYPRTIFQARKQVDLDDLGNPLSRYIRSEIINRDFSFEFLPEEEIHKSHYTIRNGNVIFENNLRRQNARLKISVRVYN